MSYNSYRAECIKRKEVRSDPASQREPVKRTKKILTGDWLAVYFNKTKQRWSIWKAYMLEQDAQKQVDKMKSYWPMNVVHRKIFDAAYNVLPVKVKSNS